MEIWKIVVHSMLEIFHSMLARQASHSKLTQGAALKRNGTLLSQVKKLLPHNCYPSGWHLCPNPNCNARFSSKKKIARCISIPAPAYCVYTPYIAQARIEPGCDGWKANAITTTLRRSRQCSSKMTYLNQMYEKKAIEGYA